MTYPKFPPIPRLEKPNSVYVMEKIDGTNGQILIYNVQSQIETGDDLKTIANDQKVVVDGAIHGIRAGSRNRWLTPESDNFNFAQWVQTYAERLVETLGEGSHFGEWWGPGIQRGYGLAEKRFSLFNTSRWDNSDGLLTESVPGLDVVPLLGIYDGKYLSSAVEIEMERLERDGSVASPGFMRPEGVVVYHSAANQLFKVTFESPEGKWVP